MLLIAHFFQEFVPRIRHSPSRVLIRFIFSVDYARILHSHIYCPPNDWSRSPGRPRTRVGHLGSKGERGCGLLNQICTHLRSASSQPDDELKTVMSGGTGDGYAPARNDEEL